MDFIVMTRWCVLLHDNSNSTCISHSDLCQIRLIQHHSLRCSLSWTCRLLGPNASRGGSEVDGARGRAKESRHNRRGKQKQTDAAEITHFYLPALLLEGNSLLWIMSIWSFYVQVLWFLHSYVIHFPQFAFQENEQNARYFHQCADNNWIMVEYKRLTLF